VKKSSKQDLKAFFATKPLLAMWAARGRTWVLTLPVLWFRLRYFATAYVPLSVKLVGASRIKLGINTAIGAHSWLNVNNNKASGPTLVIGDNSFIGKNNYFSVGKKIVMGDYCLTTKDCAFIGAGHVYDDPMKPYGTTGVTEENNIIVGVNCFFGVGARVIGNVTIGHGCVIGAGAEVRSDILPFSLVVGNPAKVIKRYDFANNAWVKWPIEADFIEGMNEEAYLAYLKQHTGAPLLHLSAAAGCLRDTA